MACEAPHMHLVHDGLPRRPFEGRITFPIVGARIHHHTLHRCCSVVSWLADGLAAVVLRNNYAPTIRVEEDLGRIKSHAVRGIERPLCAITVDLFWLHTRHEHVPVVDRKSTRLNSSHVRISYAVFCLK